MTTTKQYQLPREFAEKWVKALRSGEYKQGKDMLYSGGAYCCIGVAGKICGANDRMLDNGFLELTGPSALNKDVAETIPEQLIGGWENQFTTVLAKMNDKSYSFPEIADWIEQNVEFV